VETLFAAQTLAMAVTDTPSISSQQLV